MIIVSQNNENITKRVVNFDNIIYLQTDVIDINNVVIVYNDVNTQENNCKKDTYVLAVYKSKERAEEVLKEIVEKYKDFSIILNTTNKGECIKECNYPKVYEMPKE